MRPGGDLGASFGHRLRGLRVCASGGGGRGGVRRRELLSLILPLVGASACGGGGLSNPAGPIAVRRGQTFRITLDSNPTTGYAWRLGAPLPDVVRLVESRYFPGPDAAHLMGAGGREVWTFQAVQPGQGAIQLEYARSAGPAGRTATFTVQVG